MPAFGALWYTSDTVVFRSKGFRQDQSSKTLRSGGTICDSILSTQTPTRVAFLSRLCRLQVRVALESSPPARRPAACVFSYMTAQERCLQIYTLYVPAANSQPCTGTKSCRVPRRMCSRLGSVQYGGARTRTPGALASAVNQMVQTSRVGSARVPESFEIRRVRDNAASSAREHRAMSPVDNRTGCCTQAGGVHRRTSSDLRVASHRIARHLLRSPTPLPAHTNAVLVARDVQSGCGTRRSVRSTSAYEPSPITELQKDPLISSLGVASSTLVAHASHELTRHAGCRYLRDLSTSPECEGRRTLESLSSPVHRTFQNTSLFSVNDGARAYPGTVVRVQPVLRAPARPERCFTHLQFKSHTRWKRVGASGEQDLKEKASVGVEGTGSAKVLGLKKSGDITESTRASTESTIHVLLEPLFRDSVLWQ
ncbi:hypothetical protein C8R45DRAFT_939994 [Mycena sanguinolenta]|nr:hypothetical protein C8R45DRAFT_939994 [Mycena sanguinolenta]